LSVSFLPPFFCGRRVSRVIYFSSTLAWVGCGVAIYLGIPPAVLGSFFFTWRISVMRETISLEVPLLDTATGVLGGSCERGTFFELA